MRRAFLATLAGLAVCGRPAAAQSADAICADTTVAARILGSGPVRALITELRGLRVCLAAEGFTDSVAFRPIDWPARARRIVLETRTADDVRLMQSSTILTSWTKNGKTLPNDSVASAWRDAVVDLATAQWDAAARHLELAELEETIVAVLARRDTVLEKLKAVDQVADSLRKAVSEQRAADAHDYNTRLADAERRESIARSNAAAARRTLDAIPKTGSNSDQIRQAQDRVRAADEQVRTAAAATIFARNGGRGEWQKTDQVLADYDAAGRIGFLKDALAQLDADARVEYLRAALKAMEAQPNPEPRILVAAARIRELLAR